MPNPITHALLSVSDKTNIVTFATELAKLNIVLLSTGGTATLLKQNQLPVIDIAEFTGFPEIMGGRVKTLHSKIYAGILARHTQDENVLEQYQFPRIGLVVVNLYPFEATIANEKCSFAEAIENIDIGGPTLLRAAAKNFDATTVVVDTADYDEVLHELKLQQETSLQTRFSLAKKVFAHVAQYDAIISNYFSSLESPQNNLRAPFPEVLTLQFQKKLPLRYGENPHQQAAFYTEHTAAPATISTATQLLGKPLSYNNINDADTALACVQQFTSSACVIVKHANPCAVSLGKTQLEAYEHAYQADSSSAFGGIIAFNAPLEANTLTCIIAKQFVEVIIAPNISEELVALAGAKPNIRLLSVDIPSHAPIKHFELKSVNGGLLVQDSDNQSTPPHIEIVTKRKPNERELADLIFAWQVARFVKSNAVVYAKDNRTIGIGAGQMSRVFSTKIAEEKAAEAKLSLDNSALASDAFFPFRDSIDHAAAAGVAAIIQPGGSIRDQEVIDAANEHNLVMVFTHQRHFRH